MRLSTFVKSTQSVLGTALCTASLVTVVFAASAIHSSHAESGQQDANQAVPPITLQNLHKIESGSIYGSELMTKSEMAKFREDIKQCETPDQLAGFLANHRIRMDARAVKRGVSLN